MNGSMEKIDFNATNFSGFDNNEKILIDTGVILALANEYDAWHNTVKNLFNKYIFSEDEVSQEQNDGEEQEEKAIFLFINPTVLNEITHLADKPFKQYKNNHPNEDLSTIDPKDVINNTINGVQELIENDVLLIVDGTKDTALKQIEIFKDIEEAADAVNLSIANEFNLNFLTVDNKLVNKMEKIKNKLSKINRVYYTTRIHRSY